MTILHRNVLVVSLRLHNKNSYAERTNIFYEISVLRSDYSSKITINATNFVRETTILYVQGYIKRMIRIRLIIFFILQYKYCEDIFS